MKQHVWRLLDTLTFVISFTVITTFCPKLTPKELLLIVAALVVHSVASYLRGRAEKVT